MGEVTQFQPPPGATVYCQVLQCDASGDLTVTFPVGLFASAPAVGAQVVASNGTDQYMVEIVGDPTVTTAVIKVRKMAGLTLSILSLGVVQLFQVTGVAKVHVQAILMP